MLYENKRREIIKFIKWLEKNDMFVCQRRPLNNGKVCYSPIDILNGFLHGYFKGLGK